MKKILVAACIVASPAMAQTTHTVQGYTKSDGTYVAPHVQTNPNATKTDNWSTQGNVNPNTGQPGTVDPYKPTTANPYGNPYNTPRR